MPSNQTAAYEANSIGKYAEKENIREGILDVYVFTSSDWEHDQIDSFTPPNKNYPCTFHIVDNIELLLRQMIKEHHPYKCKGITFNENGVANRQFNTLVIGFGNVGKQALLRLIMNGQFVTEDLNLMKAIVIDENIHKLKSHFVNRYSSLSSACEITYSGIDVLSDDFFDFLEFGKLKKVFRKNEISKENEYLELAINFDIDYIVIALSNVKDSKVVALSIKEHYEKINKPIPFIAVSDINKGFHSEKIDDEIFTFGCLEEIFKHSVIIREDINQMAMAIHETYRDKYPSMKPWRQLDWFLHESNRAVADFIPVYRFLAKHPIKHEEREGFTEDAVIKNGKLSDNLALIETLAHTEHLRWNAFHFAMGYQPMTWEMVEGRFKEYKKKQEGKEVSYYRKDPEGKYHICLVPWDKLDGVSETFNEITGENRNFKNEDFTNIRFIPEFLEKGKRKRGK